MLYSDKIHYELDIKDTALCGKVGAGEYTTDPEKVTCKSCDKFVKSKSNKRFIEERARKERHGDKD